jgi:hypothetical protein
MSSLSREGQEYAVVRRLLIILMVAISLILHLVPSFAWPDCSTPLSIGGSRQMPTSVQGPPYIPSTQTLTVSGGDGNFQWSKTGGGALGTPTGDRNQSIVYTAPISNANCSSNPTIQVTDNCGNVATLKISINQYNNSYVAYYTYVPIDISHCEADLNIPSFNCAGAQIVPGTGMGGYCNTKNYYLYNYPECCGYYDCVPPPGVCTGHCSAADLVTCCNEYPPHGTSCIGTVDVRSGTLIEYGCCPAEVSICTTVDGFDADKRTINLGADEQANFTGNISTNGGGSTTWSIAVAGQTINGTGNSVSASWNGRDAYGKQVEVGSYIATLTAQTTGNTCGGDIDLRKIRVAVKNESVEKGNCQPDTCAVGSLNVIQKDVGGGN